MTPKKKPTRGNPKREPRKKRPIKKVKVKPRKRVTTKKPAKKKTLTGGVSSAVSRETTPKIHDTFMMEGAHRTKMRIIGIGGGGSNIIAEISQRVPRADFIAANTDTQALGALPRTIRTLAFGHELTQGLGSGMNAELGERAATIEKEKIKKVLEGQDICVLVATLGGGTGSGAAPVFAEVARELKNLTIGIFTMPFSFEGERRKQIAEAALERAKQFLNAYIVIPNETIFGIIDKKTPIQEALSAVNTRLASTLEGFIETIFLPGLINIDFADVRSVLEGRGRLAYMNCARATGATKGMEAARAVLANPLCAYTIKGCDRILFNIAGDKDLKMQEVTEISRTIGAYNPKARIIFGISLSPKFRDSARITLFAVGCENGRGVIASEPKEKEQIVKQPAREPVTLKAKSVKILITKPAIREAKRDPQQIQNQAKKKETQKENRPAPHAITVARENHSNIRRNALDVKKAVDQEIHDLQEREKEWDIPSFLRNKPIS